ncbi:hypothetical protein [Larkinella punicea]|uniref:hypothetical protein n=1 Tax=Larkinella punicea TaxID=2315727 RepID=UPI001058D8B6|nr:hypothetical protein [Larkinella punicea]
MQPPSTPPQKYNPYYLPVPEGCGKRTDCPYKSMPEYLQPSDFKNEILSSFDDHYCSLCKSQLKLVPPPPTPPRPPVEETTKKDSDLRPWYRKYWWAILAALLLLIAGLVYWFWPVSPAVCQQGEVIAGRDTCINDVKYQVVCDGKGGFDKGKKIGTCAPPPPPCAAGTVVNTFCRGTTQYVKLCDGKGGYTEKVNKVNSVDCGWKPSPPSPVFKPGIPYVVKRAGRCVIETYNASGGLQSQVSLPAGDPRCDNAPPAKKLN